jgi:hypothetical protein
MKHFRHLKTLEFYCPDARAAEKVLMMKNNLKRVILWKPCIRSLPSLLEYLSNNFKRLKKLDFLGIKYNGLVPNHLHDIYQRRRKVIKYQNLLKLKGIGLPMLQFYYNLFVTEEANFKEMVWYAHSTKYPE